MMQVLWMGSVAPGATMEVASPALPAEAILHKIIISTAPGLAAPINMAIGMCDAHNGVIANRRAINWISEDISGQHIMQIYGPCDIYIDRLIGDSNRSLCIDVDNQSASACSILALYALPDTCYE